MGTFQEPFKTLQIKRTIRTRVMEKEGDQMPKVRPLGGPRFESKWKEWEERIVERYGMLITTAQLGTIIGMKSYDKIKRWARDMEIEPVPVGKRNKWDAREIAKAIDRARFRSVS